MMPMARAIAPSSAGSIITKVHLSKP